MLELIDHLLALGKREVALKEVINELNLADPGYVARPFDIPPPVFNITSDLELLEPRGSSQCV